MQPIGKLFKEIWEEGKKKIDKYLVLAFLIFIPIFVIVFLSVFIVFVMVIIGNYIGNSFDDETLAWFMVAVSILVTLIIILFLGIAISYIKTALLVTVFSNDLTFEEIFKKALRYWWKVAIADLVINLIIAIGCFFFIVPGIILGIWFMWAPYLIVKKDLSIMEAFKQSKALSEGHGWEIFGRNILMILTTMAAGFVPGLNYFASLLSFPFTTIYQYRMFENLEGLKGLTKK